MNYRHTCPSNQTHCSAYLNLNASAKVGSLANNQNLVKSLIAAGAENMKWLNTFMKITELQSASKPLSPEQARVRAMKQGIDRQKLALAQERERQQNAKHAKKIQALHSKTLGL